MWKTLAGCVAISILSSPALGQGAIQSDGPIAQFYSYRLKDRGLFEDGYRAHLGWHARQNDRLVWYAWTIQSGPRRGMFVDGTAGASLADLDHRPDPAGDGADFAANAAPHADPVDIETWELRPGISGATPLEDRRPSKVIDVFVLSVAPGREAALEKILAETAVPPQHGAVRMGWYRKLRGGAVPAYMLMVSRDSWAEIGIAGGTLPEILARAYRMSPAAVAAILGQISSTVSESWVYEPRLSLIPGVPLAP